MPVHFQCFANSTDAAIHHIARRDDIRARIGLVDSLVDEHGDGVIINDIAVIIDQPVLPMGGIWVERDIG